MTELTLRPGLPFDDTCSFCSLNGIVCVEKKRSRIAIHVNNQGLTVFNMPTTIGVCRGNRTQMVTLAELERDNTFSQFMSNAELILSRRTSSDIPGSYRKRI